VERPFELASFLLRRETGWNEARIRETLASSQTLEVVLTEPVPIEIRYLTTWVSEDGSTHFRSDIYGLDALLQRALDGLSGERQSGEHTARTDSREFPFGNRRAAVDQNPLDSSRRMPGMFEVRLRPHRVRIEDYQVGSFADSNCSAVPETETPGRESAHLVYGFLDC
jgi:hypothetical protein